MTATAPSAWIAALLVAGTAAGLWAWAARRRAHRAELRRPLDATERALLTQFSPMYRRMPAGLQRELEPAVRAFLARIEFIGCNGLEVTHAMRLLVALHAAVLTRRIGIGAFASLYSVLVYPDEFVVEQRFEDAETGLVTEGTEVLSGQTIDTARVIISWRDVLEGETSDGPYNVIAHELAHYLDHALDGALSDPDGRSSWHATLEREQAALQRALDAGEETLIDAYGADDPAEFLCVATETFLEAPTQMQRLHPALYAELSRFYGLDPARWPALDPAPVRA